jgi:anaphase-promoting complex subunit 4
MESSPGPRLLQQAEKILLRPIHPHLISYCPTMDLIALVTDEENLDVYRINGQKAFGLKRKTSEMTIDCLCWEFNGQAVAVSWSDGCTDILSSETGKVLFKDLPPPTSVSKPGNQPPRISSMGWGLNFIDVEAVKRRTGINKRKTNGATTTIDFGAPTTEEWDAFKDGTTLEDFLQRQPDLQALDVAPDLPDQLAMMDMETLLPKLPAIPMPPALPFMRAPQTDSGAFSTQPQVDSLLHSHHMKDHNSVDMFIRCTDVGSVHPSIYDSLETVDVRLPSAWEIESKPLLHASHPYSCTHGLLVSMKTAQDAQTKLAFVPLTLGFIPSAGIYLHLIASKTSQLQNLLLYVQQSLQRIRTFWKHSQDLPSKFMMNISETLEEKGQGDLVQNLYHLACTGTCSPIIKEWLVDELAEQGHKRWDHIVSSSLSTLLSLIHENLLPALDRCSIVISRLRGLAKYHDQGWIFSGPVTDFTDLLTHIKNLRLLAHTTLLYAGDEKRQFASFSKWLRFSIDFEATEPDSQSRQEMEARDPGVDIGMVLEYIQYGLTKSDLGPYLRPSDQLSAAQRNEGPASYEDTRKAIDSLKEEGNYKEGALCMEHVIQSFSSGCARLFQQTSSWQESNINMNCGIVLESNPSSNDDAETRALDMRMLFEVSLPAFFRYRVDVYLPKETCLGNI